ncbi:MAG: thioesterase [Bacteroidales bacterium]|nr:thioesterase [Bacteroidales bacterium]MDD2424776.1 thioesterase [Bacteroidales bacterium]MDD3988656.1 thioesterase [Bacteroidales bacterium]
MKSLTESFFVKSYETDLKGNLKLFSLMNIVQEMAGKHADLLGFGYEDLIRDNTAWVLSRLKMKILRLPRWREEISAETWHKGGDSLFWYRDFVVCDRYNHEMILATSSWVTIDTLTRRLKRRALVEKDYKGIEERDAIAERAEKILLPPDMEFVRKREVLFSDLDINGHTNNAKYIEWALDTIPFGILSGAAPREMSVNFNTESRFGDNINFYSSFSSGRVVVEGKRDGNSIFTVQLIF